MSLIKYDQITIKDNRQRREFSFKELKDLQTSILSKGLLHPLILRNDGVTLIAGERRYRAINELYKEGKTFMHDGKVVPANHVPVTFLHELDPLTIREAELEENTIRTDLTWQELAKALSELHSLRLAQHPEHTKAELFKEVTGGTSGQQAMEARDSLIIAEHLDIPDVANAKTQKDAVKILRKIKETEHRAELAKTFDLTKTIHTIKLGDMTKLMKELPDDQFNLIITDPPYGMGADQFGDMASTGHNYEDTWGNASKLYDTLAVEGFRCTKAKAHLYAFCQFERFSEVSDILFLAGWTVWARPFIWDKGNGMLPRPEHGPRYTYECIVFANKGDKQTVAVKADVIRVAPDSQILHGAQKPVALYIDLIERSCLAGDKIIDPFGGTGTVLSAASATHTVATMFELSEATYNIALARLQGSVDGNDLTWLSVGEQNER